MDGVGGHHVKQSKLEEEKHNIMSEKQNSKRNKAKHRNEVTKGSEGRQEKRGEGQSQLWWIYWHVKTGVIW